MSKGKQVYVEGRLRQVEYTDRDGNRRTSLEVTASDIQFLGTKGEGGDESDQPEPATLQKQPAGANKALARAALMAQAPLNDSPVNDDEIPF